MTPDKLERLKLTHDGIFSERIGGLFAILLAERGEIEIGMGIGMCGDGSRIGILIDVNDGKFATAFTPKEARAVAEILEDTMKDAEPPTVKLRQMFEHVISGCTELGAKADELTRMIVDRKLN